jgi:chemotaxis protein methyltransferase CheR
MREVARRRGLASIADLLDRTRGDRGVLEAMAEAAFVSVTAMFRDPPAFRALREHALPLVAEGPVRAWCVGCATGEEVWSLAIALEELGALAGARLYATDVSGAALARARAGLLPMDRMREYSIAYQRAGGGSSLSEYCSAGAGEDAVVAARLRARVVFAAHDVAAEPPFATFELVLFRNVAMYFDAGLQRDVHEALAAALVPGGLLLLGRGEALPDAVAPRYEELDAAAHLFLRRGRDDPGHPEGIPRGDLRR